MAPFYRNSGAVRRREARTVPHACYGAPMNDTSSEGEGSPIRDQVLYHLLAADGARVLGWSEDAVTVAVGDEAPVLVLPPDLDELAKILPDFSARVGMTAVTLLVAGGPPSLAPALEKLSEELHGRATLAHVADDGTVWSQANLPTAGGLAEALRAVQASPGALPVPRADMLNLFQQRVHAARAAEEENRLFRDRLRGRRPAATTAIVATMVIVFLLQAAWGGADDGLLLAAMGANAPTQVRAGETWRVLSATFLHGGLFHLVFNALALWSVGGFLERLLGPARLLLLFTASAAVGGIASTLHADAWLSVGASGGVWGLFCGAGWLAFRGRGVLPANVAAALRTSTVQTLMLNVLVSFMPRVDMWAHFGGGLAGLAVGALGGLSPRDQGASGERTSTPLLAAGALAAALLWGSLLMAFVQGHPWSIDDPTWTRVPASATGLSLELPDELGPPDCVDGPEVPPLTTCSWGDLQLSPLVVVLVSAPLDPLPDRAAQDAVLAQIQSQEATPPGGATRVGPIVPANRDDAPGYEEVLDWSVGVRQRRRVWVFPDRMVTLDVALHPENRWVDADLHVMGSLRIGG